MARIKGTVFDWLIRLVSHDRTQMQFEWEEEGKALLLGKPMPVILAGNINTGGTIQPNSATGTVPVTEASAATISSNTAALVASGNLQAGLDTALPPSVSGQIWGTVTAASNLHPKKKVVTLAAADGGGLVAATALVAATGAFYPVIDGLLFISTVADTFAANLTISGGALVGPATLNITTVASTINTQAENMLWYDTTDGTTISLDISGATVGMVIHVVVFYHYET